MELDCELIREGLIGQPVNAWSSLAFVLAALSIVRQHRLGAGALLLTGIGSFLFHSTDSAWNLVHDAGLVLLVAVTLWAAWRSRGSPSYVGIGALAVGFGLWLASRSGGPLCDPDSLFQAHALWHLLAAAGCAFIFRADSEATQATLAGNS